MSATQSHRSEQRRLRVARKNACMGSCAPLRLWRMKRRLLSEKCRAEAASAKAISLANVSRVSEAVPISGTQHRRCEPRSLSRMDVCQWRVDRGRGSRCPPSSKACLQSNAAREKRRSRAVMCIQQLDCTTWAWGGWGGEDLTGHARRPSVSPLAPCQQDYRCNSAKMQPRSQAISCSLRVLCSVCFLPSESVRVSV